MSRPTSSPTLLAALVSIAMWLYLAVSAIVMTAFVFPVALICAPFDRRRRIVAYAAMFWAGLFDRLSPLWQTTVRGKSNLDRNKSYIFVANHQSSLDIILLLAMGEHFKWISKTSNFFVPIAGWMMWMAGYVPIRRGDRHSREKMLTACATELARGNSIAIFPEGTRNERDSLAPFKRGAFVLATKTGAEIVPIVIHGARELLPRNAIVVRRLRRCYPHIEILPPVSPAQFQNNPRTMATAVQELMEHTLVELREQTLSRPANAIPRDLYALSRSNSDPSQSTSGS